MKDVSYIMENADEAFRLDRNVNEQKIEQHARWAGIRPGMRVADLGCGPGKISAVLHRLVRPGGEVVGVDGSGDRIEYARHKYGTEGLSFIPRNITGSLDDLGKFDFIWVRLVLEYYRSESGDLVRRIADSLKPGGIICLVDIDNNPFIYHGASPRLHRTLAKIMNELEEKHDFDPYIGRKLYSFLYDLGCADIDVKVENYRVSFGKTDQLEVLNMLQKIELIPRKIDFVFDEYPGGYDEFCKEAGEFLQDPRRFAYTPLILCRGIKKV